MEFSDWQDGISEVSYHHQCKTLVGGRGWVWLAIRREKYEKNVPGLRCQGRVTCTCPASAFEVQARPRLDFRPPLSHFPPDLPTGRACADDGALQEVGQDTKVFGHTISSVWAVPHTSPIPQSTPKPILIHISFVTSRKIFPDLHTPTFPKKISYL